MNIWRRLRFPLALSVAGVGVALAACSSNNNTPTVNPNLPCGGVSGPVALVYPAPGSTGIPDNFQGVVFGSQTTLTANYQAFVVPAGSSTGTYLNFVAPAPNPLPSPNATPSFANPIYQESSSGGLILPAATQIGVYLNDANSNCVPSALLGTFTTQ